MILSCSFDRCKDIKTASSSLLSSPCRRVFVISLRFDSIQSPNTAVWTIEKTKAGQSYHLKDFSSQTKLPPIIYYISLICSKTCRYCTNSLLRQVNHLLIMGQYHWKCFQNYPNPWRKMVSFKLCPESDQVKAIITQSFVHFSNIYSSCSTFRQRDRMRLVMLSILPSVVTNYDVSLCSSRLYRNDSREYVFCRRKR